MRIYKDYNFNDLMNNCWSGALETLNKVQENDKEEELMFLLETDCFSDTPDLTDVNDLLWLESDWVFEMLGIEDEEEEEDDD